jgi:oligopeptide/dipeptide ABC transporter ATP-binding protein
VRIDSESDSAPAPALLEIRGLKTGFRTGQGWAWAADGLDLTIRRGRTLCLVGESGCGKTVTGLSILGLVSSRGGRIRAGQILFQGIDLVQLSEKELRGVRGNRISMIFQEPRSALNPLFGIGEQVAEAIRVHRKVSWKQARKQALENLDAVGFPSPDKRYEDPPCLLSGGMSQRVMIAMALSCNPELLIADEPTTALDVTIQAQILELMSDLQQKMGMGILFITHDLGVVARIADEVAVMYAGRIVETAHVNDFFREPRHPYSLGLLRSVPRPLGDREKADRPMETLPGGVPDLTRLPQGCRFQERCAWVVDRCRREEPPLLEISEPGTLKRSSACWRHEEMPSARERGEQ